MNQQQPPSNLLRLLLAWLVPGIVVLLTVSPVGEPIYDPDIWWHLAVGRYLVDNRSVPTYDPFSRPDVPWVAYSWLYELVVFTLYSRFGLSGIIAYRVALCLLIVRAIHALVTRIEKRFLVAISLTATAVILLNPLFSERPWLVTVLLTTLTLHAVVALRQPNQERLPFWLWILPIFFIIWANVHIQFIYGLIVLALGCLAPWLDTRLDWSQAADTAASTNSPRYRTLVFLSFSCLIATFINPYTVRLYAVVVEYATQPGPFLWVQELKAMEFREPTDFLVLALTASAYYVLGRRTTSTFHLLLLIGTTFLAFRARRDLWFVVLASLYILGSASSKEVPKNDQFTPTPVGRLAILTGLALLIVFTALGRNLSPARLAEVVERRFPVTAVQHVAEKAYPGPLFNDFNWGGYLIWSLPQYKVALDGRTNLHGDDRIVQIAEVWQALPERHTRVGNDWQRQPSWEDQEDFAQARLIIAPAGEPLVSLLRRDPRFQEVHNDRLAVVFIRIPQPAPPP